MIHKTDYFNNPVIVPSIGQKVLVDGYVFTVSDFVPHEDIYIVGSISMRGEGGSKEIGYYDYLKHCKI